MRRRSGRPAWGFDPCSGSWSRSFALFLCPNLCIECGLCRSVALRLVRHSPVTLSSERHPPRQCPPMSPEHGRVREGPSTLTFVRAEKNHGRSNFHSMVMIACGSRLGLLNVANATLWEGGDANYRQLSNGQCRASVEGCDRRCTGHSLQNVLPVTPRTRGSARAGRLTPPRQPALKRPRHRPLIAPARLWKKDGCFTPLPSDRRRLSPDERWVNRRLSFPDLDAACRKPQWRTRSNEWRRGRVRCPCRRDATA